MGGSRDGGAVLQNVGAGDVSEFTQEQRADSLLWEDRTGARGPWSRATPEDKRHHEL